MPEISVVIPCFNGNSTLALQLEALSRQVDAPDFEVIVSDNKSTEPPDEIVAQWVDRLPGLRVVRATQAQGISCARNVGVREAHSDNIALCDVDDAVGPHFVRAAFEGLKQAPIVTGDVQTLPGNEFARGLDHVWSLLVDRGVSPYGQLDFDDPGLNPNYPIVMGGACALKRRVVLDLNGWDQAFFPGVEDNDFALRAVRAGHRLGRSWAMGLAERRRSTNAAAYKRAFDGGYMHMKLCAAHDLWASSPNLHSPDWRFDLARLPFVVVKMALTPRERRDFLGLAGRAGLRIGQAAGYARFRVAREEIARERGLGL